MSVPCLEFYLTPKMIFLNLSLGSPHVHAKHSGCFHPPVPLITVSIIVFWNHIFYICRKCIFLPKLSQDPGEGRMLLLLTVDGCSRLFHGLSQRLPPTSPLHVFPSGDGSPHTPQHWCTHICSRVHIASLCPLPSWQCYTQTWIQIAAEGLGGTEGGY